VTPLSNGVYKLQYTLTSVGVWEMFIQIQINGVGSLINIQNSPF
jgi:hypothetical protein